MFTLMTNQCKYSDIINPLMAELIYACIFHTNVSKILDIDVVDVVCGLINMFVKLIYISM